MLERVATMPVDDDSTLMFYKTVADRLADKELRKFVADRKRAGSWEIRRRRASDRPEFVPGATDRCNGLSYGVSVHDDYVEEIEALAVEAFGKRYMTFPSLEMEGVHSLDRPCQSVYWPQVHVVADGDMTPVIGQLGSQESLERMRERQEPNNYHRAQIDVLASAGIVPVVLTDERFDIRMGDVRAMVPWLGPRSLAKTYTGPVFDAD